MMPVFLLIATACTAGATPEPVPSITTVADSTTTVESTSPTTSIPPPRLSETAHQYLAEALAAMREHSINRDSVDWDFVTASAFRTADGAEEPNDTHLAIIRALGMLRDGHSTFLGPGEADHFSDGPPSFTEPEVKLLDNGIGYVSIGSYAGDIGPFADNYAADLASELLVVDGTICGWILDLTGNGGGNMWPMLAGLSPLLTEGTVGSFTYPGGNVEPWDIKDSLSIWAGQPMVDGGLTIDREDPKPTAVLIGRRTGSSGEAVATAFHGQPRARFFGQPTAGLTTANEPVELSDGALLILTMSVFTDRTGHQYGQGIRIEPNQLVTEDLLETATGWLSQEPECSG